MKAMMKQTQFVDLLCCLAVVGALMLSTTGMAAQGATGRVQVDGYRPLSAAIDELEKRHGRAITYEDPFRESAGDMTDVTETFPSHQRVGNRRYYAPRGGAFTFTYAPGFDESDTGFERMLESLVAQYNRVGPDAKFRVSRTGKLFHVIPATRKAAHGVVESTQTPLDTRISIPAGRRSGVEQLVAIVEAVKAAGHWRFGLGTLPAQALKTAVSGAVDNKTAREAVAQVLESSPFQLDWIMFCDAGPDGRPCMLNIRPLLKQPER